MVVVYGWSPWSVDRRTRTRTAHHVEPSHAGANKRQPCAAKRLTRPNFPWY